MPPESRWSDWRSPGPHGPLQTWPPARVQALLRCRRVVRCSQIYFSSCVALRLLFIALSLAGRGGSGLAQPRRGKSRDRRRAALAAAHVQPELRQERWTADAPLLTAALRRG